MKDPSRCGLSMAFRPFVRECVSLKPLRGLGQQVRRHGQIGLGAGNIDVAEVGGQQGQAGLDIGTFPVPGHKAVNRESVPQVMEPGLPSCSFPEDAPAP